MKNLDNLNQIEWPRYLGKYIGSSVLDELFTALDLKPPRLKRNELDTFAEKYSDGIELTFTIESALDTNIEYPEGALVLSNIRFYLINKGKHKTFMGNLPFGLNNVMYENDIISVLGAPDTNLKNKNQLKWTKSDMFIFGTLNRENKQIVCFGLQLRET